MTNANRANRERGLHVLRCLSPALLAAVLLQACGGSADKAAEYPSATGGAAYRNTPPRDAPREESSDFQRTVGEPETSLQVKAMSPGSATGADSDFDEDRSSFRDDRVAGNVDAPVPAPAPPPQKPPSAAMKKLDGQGTGAGAGGGAAGGAKPAAVATDATPHEKTMLIYTAKLTMAVYQVEPGLDAVEKVARDFGGYLAMRGDRRIEIRVPREKFQQALRAIEGTGDVLHRDVRAEDVTDRYVDMESRLRNARVMRQRLQQLLERAQVKEALEIERELGRITQEIEVLEGKLKLLKDQIAFSTITVEYSPKSAAIARTTYGLPFPWLSRLGLPNLLRLNDHKESE